MLVFEYRYHTHIFCLLHLQRQINNYFSLWFRCFSQCLLLSGSIGGLRFGHDLFLLGHDLRVHTRTQRPNMPGKMVIYDKHMRVWMGVNTHTSPAIFCFLASAFLMSSSTVFLQDAMLKQVGLARSQAVEVGLHRFCTNIVALKRDEVVWNQMQTYMVRLMRSRRLSTLDLQSAKSCVTMMGPIFLYIVSSSSRIASSWYKQTNKTHTSHTTHHTQRDCYKILVQQVYSTLLGFAHVRS